MPEFAGHGLACERAERLVFRGLDFKVGPGDALLLTGPNGSGKSSLLRLMAGLLRPAVGTLTWDGSSVAHDPGAHQARLAYLGHLDALKPALTVRETVAFWAALLGGDRVDAALDAMGLARLGDIPARLLSAGQRRRLALARVLVAPRTLWLLDEPATGLDEAARGALAEALASHRAQGGMVVVASHGDVVPGGATELRPADFAPDDPFAWAAA